MPLLVTISPAVKACLQRLLTEIVLPASMYSAAGSSICSLRYQLRNNGDGGRSPRIIAEAGEEEAIFAFQLLDGDQPPEPRASC